MGFDFINNDIEETPLFKKEPEYTGPNLKTAAKMTPRKFATSVLEVYDKLGGTSWLLKEAVVDPKAFLTLLSKLIPKSVQLDDLTGFTVNVIDQFGRRIELQPNGAATDTPHVQKGSGQPLIATGGNPASLDNNSSSCPEKSSPLNPNNQTETIIDIKEEF